MELLWGVIVALLIGFMAWLAKIDRLGPSLVWLWVLWIFVNIAAGAMWLRMPLTYPPSRSIPSLMWESGILMLIMSITAIIGVIYGVIVATTEDGPTGVWKGLIAFLVATNLLAAPFGPGMPERMPANSIRSGSLSTFGSLGSIQAVIPQGDDMAPLLLLLAVIAGFIAGLFVYKHEKPHMLGAIVMFCAVGLFVYIGGLYAMGIRSGMELFQNRYQCIDYSYKAEIEDCPEGLTLQMAQTQQPQVVHNHYYLPDGTEILSYTLPISVPPLPGPQTTSATTSKPPCTSEALKAKKPFAKDDPPEAKVWKLGSDTRWIVAHVVSNMNWRDKGEFHGKLILAPGEEVWLVGAGGTAIAYSCADEARRAYDDMHITLNRELVELDSHFVPYQEYLDPPL